MHMKKFFTILAFAALILPLSCNKTDENKTVVADLQQKPATAKDAIKVITEDATPIPDLGKPVSAEITDDGEGIIKTENGGKISVFSGSVAKKAEGEFEMTDDKTKDVFGIKFVSLKSTANYSVTITYKGKAYTFNAQSKDPLTVDPTFVTVIARRFQVLSTNLTIKLPEQLNGINKTFEAPYYNGYGCPVPEIVSWLKTAVNLEFDKDFTGYTVKEIEFSSRGTFIIRFVGQNPYEGELFEVKPAGNGKFTFDYTLDIEDADKNPIFNGEASGDIVSDFQKGRVNLTLNAKGETKDNKDYEGKILFVVAPVPAK